MDQKTETIIRKTGGYGLFIVGIIIMFAAFYNGVQLFLQTIEPRSYFAFSGISLDLKNALGGSLPPGSISGSLNQELFTPEMINGPVNLTIHLFYLWFFVSIGQKIAHTGLLLASPKNI